METATHNLLKDYTLYLKLECGHSPNSIDAYLRDVDKLLSFLETEHITLQEITVDTLHRFMALLSDIGIHPRSQARILSGIKSFYRYLTIEGKIEHDPTELIESPKIGFRLPEVLSIEEIDAILSAIDLSKDEGQRNKAILETLYSCGLRVSELITLKFSDLYFDEGFIRVTGKGNKQRLIPISSKAIHEIKLYYPDRNKIECKKGFEDSLFLSRRGTALSRIMVFHIIKELTELAGIKKNVSPHTFRHSFASHLLEGGANLRAIQAMLGHEKITTTEIYTHVNNQHLREEILAHHPWYNKAGFSPSFSADKK